MKQYDFVGFTYNGKHSIDDFGIYRVSDGNRYNDNLVPQLNDKTADIVGGDGQYFFGSTHKTRQFSISIAFDSLTEQKYREMRQWLDGKQIHDLIFDEVPYKVYSAKVTGTPQLKTVCFDQGEERIYKGEGTIQFTCYYPYAHTQNTLNGLDGRDINNYSDEDYTNKEEWQAVFDENGHTDGNNPGDIPAPFIITFEKVNDDGDDIVVQKGSQIYVGDLNITIEQDCKELEWDSKTGLVTGLIQTGPEEYSRTPIKYSGVSYGAIPVGGISIKDIYYFYKTTENNEVKYYRECADKYKYVSNAENSSAIKTDQMANSYTIQYNYWYY